MIVRLIKKSRIYNFMLPNEVKGNYWITDNDSMGNTRNLINVEECDGQWKIKSDFETKIMSGENEIESAILKVYNLYFLKINTENEYVILYCSPSVETDIKRLKIKENSDIIIGNDMTSNIIYSYPLVSKQQARMKYNNGKWTIEDLNSRYGTYVNNNSITSQTELEYGDIIFIMGLKITIIKDIVIINSIGNLINYDKNMFDEEYSLIQRQTEMDNVDEETIEFYKEDDYFYRSPRFKTKIEPVNIGIDSPPGKTEEDKTPLIYSIGPMLSMAFMSGTSGITALNTVLEGKADFKSVAPTVISSAVMLSTMLMWPMMTKAYQQRQIKKQEKTRQKKYTEYVNDKRNEIQSAMKIQREILIDNYLPIQETKNVIYSKKRNLWEREIDQDDFLDLRLGIGTTELEGNVNFPQEHFSLSTDNLLSDVYKLGKESRLLEDVPISLSLIQHNVTAIIGNASIKQDFINGLVLQMLAYHSYDDLKIVLMTDEKNKDKWDYLKIAPHCWNNERTVRYYSTSLDDAKAISLILEQELQARKYKDVNGERQLNNTDYKQHKPYYVIITDNYKMVREVEIIKDVAELSVNVGFSLLTISPRLVNIPNDCNTFISVGEKKSGIFENELVSNKQKEFKAEADSSINMYDCCKFLANIPIDIEKESRVLPKSVSFLEMYNVGMVEQLNIINRWKTNDPTKTLQAPVGVDKSGELFKLDLHEKSHGPHGLIAGMTGSGKSEFIISYILSMALNYHPYEVSFVLIDYKGGGLTGAFENKETGMKLPHLAGTITNLDTVEMNRALASIQSELRKRQRLFNEARDSLNESTIDIYKYQSLFRKGLVKKPIAHLFIISDEFAELKAQRPEFMDQLISTSRIGRSLGVHLILATQKPAGVVNDQIWSNSKFRVCLKVQDKSDSMDMIKCADAAALKNVGRFYLQVGYNELFAQGQAAWAGAKYYPTEKRKKKVDQNINIVDNVGNIIKTIDNKKNEIQVQAKGEEITNIIKYIISESNKENINVEQLWLDRIPNVIYIEDLKKKYNYKTVKNYICPIIGEYDDPDNQVQNILTLPLSNSGNSAIFGTAGSGKEIMLTSLIYSSISTHDSKEINFYILDFGAETLTMFKNAPHVGDVLLGNSLEKINNLFKMISQITEERKKMFLDYNGSYDFYINHGGRQIPLISIVINNIEGFLETYPDFEDVIGQLTRECPKYGINFIVTTNGPNTMRYRLRQNFSQNIVLQFNDPSDYATVIPKVRRKEPSKNFGRGLIGLDGIYEFQTAYAYKEAKLADYIRVICNKLNVICTYKARKIPILPEIVKMEDVESSFRGITRIPVGIAKETLETSTISLKKGIFNVTGEDVTTSGNFVVGLTNMLRKIQQENLFLLDGLEIVSDTSIENFEVDTGKCVNGLTNLLSRLQEIETTDGKVLCIFTGIGSIIKNMDMTKKTELEKLFKSTIGKDKFKLIVVDSLDSIKSILYESWYKEFIDLSESVWIGNGISNQFTLKVSTSSRILRQEVAPGFGYCITKGKAELIKLLSRE